MAYDPFLIIYYSLLLAGLTRHVLDQLNSGLSKSSSHSLDISLLYQIIRHLVRLLDLGSCSGVPYVMLRATHLLITMPSHAPFSIL